MKRWLYAVAAWFDSRMALSATLGPMLNHPVPRMLTGPKGWWYVFGSGAMTLLMIQIVIAGKSKPPIGGTSAVAPLWAGLVARINQKLIAAGKPTRGFINTLIHGDGFAGSLRDIVTGDNDIDGDLHKCAARAGWGPRTGLGSPSGVELLKALT